MELSTELNTSLLRPAQFARHSSASDAVYKFDLSTAL